MNSVLVIGRGGQVGKALVTRLSANPSLDVSAFDRSSLDITDRVIMDSVIRRSNPQIVVNAAAFTNVEKAESEERLAYSVNSEAPKNIARICKQLTIPLIHISSEYVFDGRKGSPYIESDEPNPLNVYGKTKLEGEDGIRLSLKEHIIVRTSWVFSETGNNFVKTMLALGAEARSLAVVSDQIGGPTSAAGIAEAIHTIVTRYLKDRSLDWGVYNFCGVPAVSWFEFAQAIFQSVGDADLLTSIPDLEKISAADYKCEALRPQNSRLNCDKIFKSFGVRPDDWAASLRDVMHKINSAI
ncbi:dTDP-4-dehydrorhamnose reductase [Litorivicinus sp.]|nr:dTDP-4-dehydrorhamnose reductase [Litorivicinus sp.]